MNKLVIAIDCDDVLLPSVPAIVAHYNATYGTEATNDDFYNEDPAIWGVGDSEQKYGRIREYLRSKEFAEAARPFTEAIHAVRTLARNHELHLVTGRSQTVDMATDAMLDAYFKDLFVSVEHVGPVQLADGTYTKRTKGEVCNAIGADALIDDNLHHARNVLDAGINHVILFGDYGWNKGEDIEGVVRCRNWGEVMKRIEELEHAA